MCCFNFFSFKSLFAVLLIKLHSFNCQGYFEPAACWLNTSALTTIWSYRFKQFSGRLFQSSTLVCMLIAWSKNGQFNYIVECNYNYFNLNNGMSLYMQVCVSVWLYVFVCVGGDKTSWISILIHFLYTSFIWRAFLSFLTLIWLPKLTLKPNSVTPRLLFCPSCHRDNEENEWTGWGVDVRFLIFSFLCTTGVSWFTCSDTQLLFNTGSKTETQYEAGSLVKQQQVKDAVLLNVKKKQKTKNNSTSQRERINDVKMTSFHGEYLK